MAKDLRLKAHLHSSPSLKAAVVADLLNGIWDWLRQEAKLRPWTAEEAGEYLSVGKKTIRTWMSRHQIPHIKLGSGQVRYLKTQLDDWLKKREVKAEP